MKNVLTEPGPSLAQLVAERREQDRVRRDDAEVAGELAGQVVRDALTGVTPSGKRKRKPLAPAKAD